MYQKILIGSSKIIKPSSELFLDYYLTKKEPCEEERYGIRITAYDSKAKRSEREQVHSVFDQKEKAESFCYSLILNQVTPIALQNIIEDYIFQCTGAGRKITNQKKQRKKRREWSERREAMGEEEGFKKA